MATNNTMSRDPESIELTPAAARPADTRPAKPTVSISEPEGETITAGAYKGYTVVKIEEKHGPLHRAIPAMPLPLAVILCIINVLVPGLGTLLSSFTVFCCGQTRIESRAKAFGLNILAALLQMITFVLIVGWIWSILWGMNFIQFARDARKQKGYEPATRI